MDGANLNAILGRFRPGEAGFDVMHFNLHKTFSHAARRRRPGRRAGGRQRAAGAVPAGTAAAAGRGRRRRGAAQRLGRPLDARRALRARGAGARPDSIGRVRSFTGNFGMFVRAYTYIRSNGDAGLRAVSDDAVLAANYLRVRLADAYDLPYDRICKHEVVFSGRRQKRQHGVTTLDIAKAILDHGIHPPTIYFPLIVEEALMIEPTETESLETLDRFVEVMLGIAERAESDAGRAQAAPRDDPGRPPGRGDRRPPARPAVRLRGASASGSTTEAGLNPEAGERVVFGTRRRIAHGVPVVTKQPDGLVERMQSGDLDAFEEFFNTYKRPVYTTALAITRDPFLAEEILQDCFVKAYRVRHRLRTDRLAAALAAARHHQPVLQPHRATPRLRRAADRADQQPGRRPHLATGPGGRVAGDHRGAAARDRRAAAQAADRDHPVLPARLLAWPSRPRSPPATWAP